MPTLPPEDDRYRGFFDESPLALAAVAGDGAVESLNRRFVAEFGYSREELPTIEQWWLRAYPDPRYRASVKSSWESAVARAAELGGEVEAGEYLVSRRDGTSGTYLIGATLVRGTLLASFVDMTERLASEKAARASEATTRLLLDSSPAYYVAVGADGRIRAMNRALLEALDTSEEEALGLDYLANFVPEEDRAPTAEVMGQILRGVDETVNENRIVSRLGRLSLVEWRGRCVRAADGSVDLLVGVGIDITERVRTRHAFRESERRFKALFDNAPIPLALFTGDGKVRDLNRRFQSLFGYSMGQHRTIQSIWDRAYPDPAYRAEIERRWSEAAVPGGRPFEALESRIVAASGEELVVLVNTALLADEILVSFLDITGRKKAESAAREAYGVLLSVSEGVDEPIYVADPDTYELLYANEALQRVWGPPGGRKCHEYLQGRDSPCSFCTNGRLFGGNLGRPYIWEFRNEATGRWYRCIDKAIRWTGGRMVRYEMAIDIDDRKRAEQALRESLDRYRTLTEIANAGIWQVDAEGRTIYANPAMLAILGCRSQEDIGDRRFSSFFAPESQPAAAAAPQPRAAGLPSSYEATLLGLDGSRRELLVSGAAVQDGEGRFLGTIASFFDLTAKRRAESLLAQAEEEQIRRERVLRAQNEGLLDLVVGGALLRGDFGEALREVTERAAGLAGVARASVWLFSEDGSSLRCADLYEPASGRHSSGELLRAADFPAYALALRRGEMILAREVRADPRTSELPASYYDGHGISSLLDAPMRLDSRRHGVLCLEAVGAEREWSPEDERLATMLATVICLAYQAAERARAQAETEAREAALRTIIDAAPYAIVLNRASDGTIVDVNAAYLEANGLADPSEVIGRPSEEVTRLADPGVGERLKAELRERGRVDSCQYQVFRRGGQLRDMIASIRVIQYRGESCYVTLVMDVTPLKAAEAELRRLNAELERKVEERTEDLAHTNLELQAVNVGLAKAMEELKEAQGKILVSEKLAALGRLVAGIAHELNTPLAAIASSARIELRNLGMGLDELALAAARLGPEELGLVREARSRAASAERRSVKAEPAAERSARRAAEAILAEAGVAEAEAIAEDLVELGVADLTGRAAPLFAGPRGGDFLTLLRGAVGSYRAALIAEDAVAKAARVVSALRTYARGGEDEAPSAVRLAPEIRGLLDLYYNRTKRGIEIVLDMPEELEVFGRREGLGRIWFNILNNAIQAVGERGLIELSAALEGGSVLVSIADSGPGIPDEIKGRIFEPFFTTKGAGEGTGLGLDIARRLARENGGDISFASRPGRTVFTVRLPLAKPPATEGKDHASG